MAAEIDAQSGRATQQEIRDARGEALSIRTDVAEQEEVRAMAAAAMERYGRIDIPFNSAGIQMYGRDTRLHELSHEVWERTLAVNLRGHMLCAKYAIPPMLQQQSGCIINFAFPHRIARL